MEAKIGTVSHFYTRLCVAVLQLEDEILLGDEIHLLGRITDFTQSVTSLEIEHKKVPSAAPGEEVALEMIDTVREGDVVMKVMQE